MAVYMISAALWSTFDCGVMTSGPQFTPAQTTDDVETNCGANVKEGNNDNDKSHD